MIHHRFLPLLGLGLLAYASPLHADPYTAWKNDYTGSEAGTLLLWKFDQPTPNANSADTSKYSATITANASSGVEAGKFGEGFYSATRSTANDSYAQASGSGAVFSSTSLSVEFWFKPIDSGVAAGNLNYFFDKKYASDSGISLALNNVAPNTGTLQLSVGNGAATRSLRTGTLSWDASLWYHIAVTYENVEGDGHLKIYRNGELMASTVATDFGDLAAGTSLWRMGNRLGSSFGSVPGTYDNFRVSSIAYEYSTIPEPSAALLVLPVIGAGSIFLKRKP